jgi:hypothetical protein
MVRLYDSVVSGLRRPHDGHVAVFLVRSRKMKTTSSLFIIWEYLKPGKL